MGTKNDNIIVFDLDDTLYKEIDFLKSAYKEISIFLSNKIDVPFKLILSEMIGFYYEGINAFKEILKKYSMEDVCIEDLIKIYRNHKPQICLEPQIEKSLVRIKKEAFKIGLITDGRSVQQRNKIQALGLAHYFDDIIISEEFGSEKPNVNNFKYFEDKYGAMMNYIYIGDNTKKDFIAPNNLGWKTICLLDNGNNIHEQIFDLEENKKPKYTIKKLCEIEGFINQLKHVL